MPVKAYFSNNKQFNFASDKAKQKENVKQILILPPYSTYENFLLHYYILLQLFIQDSIIRCTIKEG